MDERLFNVVLTLLPVIGAVLTYFIVPYLKASIGAEKLEQYKEWTRLAVTCAEMLWAESGRGEDKKEYAVKFLDRLFNSKKVMLTKEQINVLIEAAVLELNHGMKTPGNEGW